MNTIDIIFLIFLAISVLAGFFKGLIRQILTILGIITVATLTATIAPYVQSWFVNVIENDKTRNLISFIVAAFLIALAYGVAALLISRLLKRLHVLKFLDRMLGGLLGFAVVYLIFAVIFALFNETGEQFMPRLKALVGDSFVSSWVGQHIYANNFFGRWIIVDIAKKLLESLTPAV